MTVDDLSEGLGLARWGDDEATLRRVYPEAYVRHLPGVGAPLIVPRVCELPVKGFFFLTPRGVESIVLSESSEMEGRDVLPCVQGLARCLGFGPVADEKRQTWMVGGVQVLLQLCSPFEEGGPVSEFYLRVNRPGLVLADFRIFDTAPSWPRRKEQVLLAKDCAVLSVPMRSDSFVVCPFCGKAFSLADTARWDGSRHLTCGQRLQLEPRSGP